MARHIDCAPSTGTSRRACPHRAKPCPPSRAAVVPLLIRIAPSCAEATRLAEDSAKCQFGWGRGPTEQKEFEEILKEMETGTLANDKGCLRYEWYRSDAPHTYILLERWADRAAVLSHLLSFFSVTRARVTLKNQNKRATRFVRGTDGSHPSSSSGESGANSIPGSWLAPTGSRTMAHSRGV